MKCYLKCSSSYTFAAELLKCVHHMFLLVIELKLNEILTNLWYAQWLVCSLTPVIKQTCDQMVVATQPCPLGERQGKVVQSMYRTSVFSQTCADRLRHNQCKLKCGLCQMCKICIDFILLNSKNICILFPWLKIPKMVVCTYMSQLTCVSNEVGIYNLF